jgi:hypothetical protein
MGSLFKPKVVAPPTPEKPLDYNVDDLIGGTKQRTVTNADGSKTVVISENLTPEMKAVRDNLKRLADDSLAKYESLVKDPFLNTMPEFKAQVDTIYNQQVRGINDAYKGAARATENAANRFGAEDSTASALARAENTKNLAGALGQASEDKIGLTNSLRQQEMGTQLQAYGLASGRQDTTIAQGLQTLGLGSSITLANAARNDNYQNKLFNSQLMYMQAKNAADAQNKATQGQLFGTLLGSAAGSKKYGFGG